MTHRYTYTIGSRTYTTSKPFVVLTDRPGLGWAFSGAAGSQRLADATVARIQSSMRDPSRLRYQIVPTTPVPDARPGAGRVLTARPGRQLLARRELARAYDLFEPRVAAAFLSAVESMRGAPGVMRDLTAAVERGDVSAVEAIVGAAGDTMRGVGLAPGIASVQDELIDALRAGGVSGQRLMGPTAGRLMASLDVTNPEAVRYLRENLPTLIREITDSQRASVQQALVRGMTEGRPAPLIAREIRDSVGLTSQGERAVANFRRQLETGQLGSGVAPTARRLSAVEQAQAGRIFGAAASGTPVPASRVSALVERYSESLVNRRAKDIARTEVHNAFTSGQKEIWRQAQDRGLLDPQKTRRFWLPTRDDRLRPDHAAVPDMNPEGVGLDEPFQTPVGPVMHPGESGVAEFDINCRCTEVLEIRE